MNKFEILLQDISRWTVWEKHLTQGVRPILQVNPKAKILIAGQAPGRKAHQTGLPFDDASGDRLRTWMGVSKEVFYDSNKIAILPMSFCYPGTGKTGDLPPRTECEPAWHKPLLDHLANVKMTLVIGLFAQSYHFGKPRSSLTERVKSWQMYWPKQVPLPHPSPRNNIWLSRNPWFERDLLPVLRKRITTVLRVP